MGNVSFDISNNIEMKVKSDKDTTGIKKISIIDELGASMSYNMADKNRPWSNLSMRIRLKWWKHYTFNMNAVFSTYAYELDENGRPYIGNHTEWGYGRFGRFQGTSQNISFTLNPEKLRKWFGGGSDDDEEDRDDDEEGIDTDIESNIDDDMVRGQRAARKKSGNKAETDDDGYMLFNMPWSLTFGYGITMSENTAGKFNTKTMRYPYRFTQTLNVSGNIRLSEGWNINFSSGYDFENKKMSMTTASLSRDLHCFNMSCSVVLVTAMPCSGIRLPYQLFQVLFLAYHPEDIAFLKQVGRRHDREIFFAFFQSHHHAVVTMADAALLQRLSQKRTRARDHHAAQLHLTFLQFIVFLVAVEFRLYVAAQLCTIFNPDTVCMVNLNSNTIAIHLDVHQEVVAFLRQPLFH